jgi:hypothetical protein
MLLQCAKVAWSVQKLLQILFTDDDTAKSETLEDALQKDIGFL